LATKEDRDWVMQMPPYLIGLALAFWGVMLEQVVIGLMLGVFLESHNFYKTRWNFSYDNYVRGWHVSVVFAILTAVIYWVDGYRASEMRVVFEWLPVIFSPLAFMQHYGKADYNQVW